jgi:hypothetical protein
MMKRGLSTLAIVGIGVAVIAAAIIGYMIYSSYNALPAAGAPETGTPAAGTPAASTPPASSSGGAPSAPETETPPIDTISGGDQDESTPETTPPAGGQEAVDLGTAGSNFVILSKSGISTTGTTSITGDIGVSPIDQTAITGFSQIMDPSNEFSTSAYVTGKIYAADYAVPTPAKLTTGISDMEAAYTDAAGRTNPAATELGAGNIDGMTLAPGLYKWGTGVTIPTGVTLSGSSNDVWVFQIAQDLTVGSGAIVTLSGGAQAKNVFWQVAGKVTLGTTSQFKGNILCQTNIVLSTGSTLNGRALAQTAVTLDACTVTLP